MHIICDVGTKHFCYLLFDEQEGRVRDFAVAQLDDRRGVVAAVFDLLDAHRFDGAIVEQQVRANSVCVRIQTAIECYCYAKRIPYRSVPAARKFAQLSIVKPKAYSARKRASVKYGSSVLAELADGETTRRVEALNKKDDFYDCLLMAIGELCPLEKIKHLTEMFENVRLS